MVSIPALQNPLAKAAQGMGSRLPAHHMLRAGACGGVSLLGYVNRKSLCWGLSGVAWYRGPASWHVSTPLRPLVPLSPRASHHKHLVDVWIAASPGPRSVLRSLRARDCGHPRWLRLRWGGGCGGGGGGKMMVGWGGFRSLFA